MKNDLTCFVPQSRGLAHAPALFHLLLILLLVGNEPVCHGSVVLAVPTIEVRLLI